MFATTNNNGEEYLERGKLEKVGLPIHFGSPNEKCPLFKKASFNKWPNCNIHFKKLTYKVFAFKNEKKKKKNYLIPLSNPYVFCVYENEIYSP